ncbi:5-methylcytosine g t mismatch-specific dna [Neofusicoccum parvum]|nr:5-methylcytosine g t mismatch-specific dna [Neofusicoccum parvum]
MCRLRSDEVQPTEEETGVSWGEILEFVSGRRELPQWPPFSIDAEAGGLGISGFNQAAPMQKLDIDVPEEYRDHYIKQSKKTKLAVQNWLATQPEASTSPPQEVDDETLTFAMLTHLEAEKRPIFTALLRGMTTIPASRAPTPLNVPRPELLVKTAVALQRLYRLSKPPRDPECAIFLLNHPTLHSILATLAAVSSGEWEILISGRFDGFLWSGAEGPVPAPNFGGSSISRGPTATPLSRTTTPFSNSGGPSRGPTPFSGTPGYARSASTAPSSFGAPVQMDEEVEIATLAEVEREIFLGMEALEDAFEALHCRAEGVRRALRERSAGLAMAAQARRGSMDGGVEVRLGTPASGVGGWGGAGWETETDDGLDERSELAPDDSASNISYSRRRRPDRRKQRNTPAPVEEEDESDVTEEAQRRR